MIFRLLHTGMIACAFAVPALAAACEPTREPVQLQLADFSSPAEIVTPPTTVPQRGLAVLFAGSDIADRDGAIVGDGDKVVSRPIRQIADRLACAGYASIRYNKRYVTGPATADRAKFDLLTGADLAADGRAALAFVGSRRELADLPIALVGWSEGTTVAMAVAAVEPAVRAVILIAPIIASPAQTVQAHYLRVGKPYLQRYATNGALDAEAIARADGGDGGALAKVFVRMFRGFRPGERLNPLLDTNKDGRVAFAEADPIIKSWYADTPNGGLGIFATGRALKGVAQAYPSVDRPLLILQGLRDGNVDPEAARAFAGQAKARVTLLTYPGLGHSLGSTRSVLEDGLRPMTKKPLDDLVRWLQKTLPVAGGVTTGRL